MLGSNFRLLCQLPNPISGSPLSFLEPPSLGCVFVHSMESVPKAISQLRAPGSPPRRKRQGPHPLHAPCRVPLRPRPLARAPPWLNSPPNLVVRLFGSEAMRNLILKVWRWRWEAGAVTVECGTGGSSPARGWMEAGVGTVGGRECSPGMGCGRRPPALATGLDPI